MLLHIIEVTLLLERWRKTIRVNFYEARAHLKFYIVKFVLDGMKIENINSSIFTFRTRVS